MTVVAYRGTTRLEDEYALRAYLASLIRLENVGVLLGSGASCSAGGRTMAGLWADFSTASPDELRWLLDNAFIREEHTTPRPPIEGGGPRPPEAPNVEALADALEIAILEWSRLGDDRATLAKEARTALFRAVVRASILRADSWTQIGGTDVANDGLAAHRSVLQKLVSARQPGQAPPWVFTTNYDLAVEWAAEAVDLQVLSGFLGLHGRRFSPQSFDLGFRNIQARGEARFGVYNIYLAKLHGSLTWKEHDGHVYELPASQAWNDIHAFSNGTNDDLNYMVMPRAAKYLQTVGFVLGELLRRFSEFLARPQTALVVAGYGFGDEHINRLIRSALLNPTLQVVVYLPEFMGDMTGDGLPPTVSRLLALRNPRLTIVGGGAEAHFSELAKHLPDPSIYDEDLRDLERRLRPQNPDPEPPARAGAP